MKVYVSIIKYRLLALLQYRMVAITGIFTQIFWGIIKVMVLTAFYSQTTKSQPISLLQAITFIWLAQILFQLLPWNTDKEMEEQIRSGNIVYELVRPLDLYWICFSKSMATCLIPTIVRSIPLFLLIVLFLGMPLPMSLNAGITFGISLVFAILLATSITTVLIISFFWTISGEGIKHFVPSIATLLSGTVVPLPLFPKCLHPFLNIQPFRGIVDIPCRLYTGVIQGKEAFYCIIFQLFWIFVFIFLGRWLMDKVKKYTVIQGG